jgi:hypothetical protein
MLCNTLKYWGFGLCPSSGILKNTMFRKLDVFPSSYEGETPTLLGPLKRTKLVPLNNSVLPECKASFFDQTLLLRKEGLPCFWNLDNKYEYDYEKLQLVIFIVICKIRRIVCRELNFEFFIS